VFVGQLFILYFIVHHNKKHNFKVIITVFSMVSRHRNEHV